MPRFDRSLTVDGVYTSMLEKLLPGLEKRLCVWLARLEAKVADHESRYGVRFEDHPHPNRLRRAVKTDLDAGKPSVVVLGARLKSEQRFCHALIRRTKTLLGDKRSAPRYSEKRRRVGRLSEHCER